MTTKVTVHPANVDLVVRQINHQTNADFAPRQDIKFEDGDKEFYVFNDNAIVVYENHNGVVRKRAGTFELFRSGFFFKEWRWRFVASNGRTVFSSTEGYENKLDCRNSIPTLFDIIQAKMPD